MTARELRTRRRAEERKTRKSQPLGGRLLSRAGLEPRSALPAHLDLGVSPETLEEFGPEFIAQANAVREHVPGKAPQPRSSIPTHLDLGVSPETLEEFGPEFIAEADAIRERVHRGAGIIPGQSTGPRSSMGKATSSRNSFKHGLASGSVVVPGEDPAAFDALLADLSADHAPANSTEELLVHEMAQSYWLMQRATRLQNACWAGSEVDGKQLALFLRYRTTYERAFHKALNTLLQLKKQRAPTSRQFVSQNTRKQMRPPQFVSQKSRQHRPSKDEAAFLSGPRDRFAEPSGPRDRFAEPSGSRTASLGPNEPKAQGGFVSQKAHRPLGAAPDSAHSIEFVRQYEGNCPSFP